MAISVELFTTADCPHCNQAVLTLQRVVKALNQDLVEWRVVNVLDEIDYAVALGVLATPALVIDGKLIFTSIPTENKLRKEIVARTSC